MQSLQATKVHEVSKASVIDAPVTTVRDTSGSIVSQSEDGGMRAGDFYFRPNLISRYEQPSWFARVFLRKQGKTVDKLVETIVISCPFCGLGIMTPLDNKILQLHPLTLEKATACPYAPKDTPHSFRIEDGKVITA
jgi:hypothetical protein